MFWKVYRKGMINHIDKVWYTLQTTAQEVHADLCEDFDFEITVAPDSED